MCFDCEICAFGDGGCMAGMRDDEFVIASKKQLIERLDNHKYERHRKLIKKTLIKEYLYNYDKREYIVIE